MTAPKRHTPPRWAQRFIEWYCRPEIAEDLLGDLTEYFERNVEKVGVRRANFIYIVDAFKFFRTYTIRRPNFVTVFINWIMIRSYIKTSGRNLLRNKLFSFINTVGLAISMSVGLLLIAFLHDLNSYDRFHEKGNRIYRIISQPTFDGNQWGFFASTSMKAGSLIKEKIPGIEDIATLRNGFRGDAVIGDNTIPMTGYWADPSLFKVFTFPLIRGDEKTALEAPYSIVLTEQSAKKFFGDKEALGQMIKFDTTEYQVTGVMKDIPFFSHLHFEALISLSTFVVEDKDRTADDWGDMFGTYVYCLLPANADLVNLQHNLDGICRVQNSSGVDRTLKLGIQPLHEIVLGEGLSNATGPTIQPETAWSLGALAAVVILSACFNYTNLSIARSLRRFKEVGLRKAIGAARSQVRQQFLYEAIIISLAALLLSFGIFLATSGVVVEMAPRLNQLVKLDLTPTLIIYFVFFSIVVGVVAGFLPAVFFSRINVIQALKDSSSVKVFRHVNFRRVLVVVQYTFTLVFITATLIGYKQYKSFLAFDLGYDTANILNVRLLNNKPEVVVKEFSAIPEVVDVSKSSLLTSIGSFWGSQMKYEHHGDSIVKDISLDVVDENYFSLHGHTFVAGTNFKARPKTNKEVTEAVVTEETLKEFRIGDPGDPHSAIGEEIICGGNKYTIIGVIKDFHYGKLENEIEPVVFSIWTGESHGFVNLKIQSTDLAAAMAKIEEAWKRIDKIHPMEARFYNEALEEAYAEYSIMVKIIGILSLLAISIASMGMFGMVVFTTETKLKEISIRKVLGANIGNLVALLSRNFVLLLGISAAIALPLTYFAFERIFLPRFPYHTPVGIFELFIGFIGVLSIAFVMIGSQTLKAANTNPSQVLKSE